MIHSDDYNEALELIEQLRAEVAEAREGYHALDKNWDAAHDAALGAIRQALEMPDATVPELCQRIVALKATVAGEPLPKPRPTVLCPFFGSQSLSLNESSYVECDGCLAQGPYVSHDAETEEEYDRCEALAVKLWDNRFGGNGEEP